MPSSPPPAAASAGFWPWLAAFWRVFIVARTRDSHEGPVVIGMCEAEAGAGKIDNPDLTSEPHFGE